MAARVGIDLGTTNTVVAWADRGNYPVLALSGSDESRLSIPTLMAWKGPDLRLGWEALALWEEPGWQLLGSPKRWIGVPEPEVLQGGVPGGAWRIEELLCQFFRRLHEEILACPHLEGEEKIEAMVGVPANANSLQRLRTLQAARQAGFRVLGLLSEPTAAAIEYAQRHPGFGKARERRHVLVYDLGGGTFDAAVVRADPDGFSVVCSAGIERLGGDDFDQIMAELALSKVGLRWEDLGWQARHRLLLRCREAKEALRSTTKKWLLDLGDLDLGQGEVALYMAEYAERCLPLLEQTIEALKGVLDKSQLGLNELDALLLVGGGSQMPLVQRRCKELVGSRLKISPHPFASTALGLAVHAERAQARPVEERLGRHFGVWREAESGARPIFDPIFDPETRLPPPGEKLRVRRAYHPVHNIGHFRFEECATLDPGGNPIGHRTPWCEIRFPFDPGLGPNDRLEDRRVERTQAFAHLRIEECYECDPEGVITVRLVREAPALGRSYLLYGPEQVAPIRPVKGKARPASEKLAGEAN